MAKDNRDSLLRRGNQLLDEWGAPKNIDVASIDTLRSFAGRDAAADVAIAARLGALADAASVAALQSLEKSSPDKSVHKEVRRALYRLEQRNVDVPDTSPQTPAPPLLSHAIEGYVSAIDGNGDRLVWLVKPRSTGVLHLYAVVNDPLGLREVEVVEVSRKVLREARESLLRRHEIALVEVDWHYGDFLIDRAVQWARQLNRSMHGDYGRLRTALIPTPVASMRPPIESVLAADEIRHDNRLLGDSASVLDEKELRTWFLPRTELSAYLDEIRTIEDSVIILPPAQQQERLRMVEESAVEELFGGEHRESWSRRLEEMAYFFHLTARPEDAQKAFAVALALASSRQGGRGIPFFETLVRAGLLFWKRDDERRQNESASGQLVLTPQQALLESRQHR